MNKYTPLVPVIKDFRKRLVVARDSLITQIIDEHDPERTHPNPALIGQLANLRDSIMAVDDMISDADHERC